MTVSLSVIFLQGEHRIPDSPVLVLVGCWLAGSQVCSACCLIVCVCVFFFQVAIAVVVVLEMQLKIKNVNILPQSV